jgi:prevent-host-death family protein
MKNALEQRVGRREVKQHLTRYVKAAKAGERIVITRRGKPVALLSPLPQQKRSLTPEQQAALERLLSQSHPQGGRAPSRGELEGVRFRNPFLVDDPFLQED